MRSELPWKVRRVSGSTIARGAINRWSFCIYADGARIVADQVDEANAQFIVTACNNFDRMKALLEEQSAIIEAQLLVGLLSNKHKKTLDETKALLSELKEGV